MQPVNNIENKTPREILSKFYADNHLEQDGGQSSSSVKIEVSSKFHFYFPNFNARRKAVVKHDIHHLLTEYNTTVAGKSEISTWEIASGCKNYWVAFLIDTNGAMLGIPFNFWNVLKAFSRGRRTKNLYHDLFSNDQALDMKISELRVQLHIDKQTKNTKPTFADFILFSLFVLYGIIYSVISLVFLPFIILYTIYTEIRIAKVNR